MAHSRSGGDGSWLIETLLLVSFLALLAWFLLASGPVEIPPAPAMVIAAEDIAPQPVRTVQSDQPVTTIAGYEMRCMECHRLFTSQPRTSRRLSQHQQIVLDHGLNDRCFNCHDIERRDRLALGDGRTIPYTQVARLCAKCHGPTWRDWQHGMHGKALGSWDTASPARRRLGCSQCHDPHAPAFDPIRPLPGPHTLRMGQPRDQHEGGPRDREDPLRRWQEESRSPHRPLAPGLPPAGQHPQDDGGPESTSPTEATP